MKFGHSIEAYGGPQARHTVQRPRHFPKILMGGPPRYPVQDITLFGARWCGVGPADLFYYPPYQGFANYVYPTMPTDAQLYTAYRETPDETSRYPDASINYYGRAALLVDLEDTSVIDLNVHPINSAEHRFAVEYQRQYYEGLRRMFPKEFIIAYPSVGFGNTGGPWPAESERLLSIRRQMEVIDSMLTSNYNPASPGNVVSQEDNINNWTYQNVRAWRAGADLAPNQPLVGTALTNYFYADDFSPIPDAQILSQARAAIRGGAHYLFFWDQQAYDNQLPYDHPVVIAEQQRMLNLLRIAWGMRPIQTFQLPSESSGSSIAFSGDSTGGPAAFSTGSVPTSSISLPSWVSQFSSPSSSARAACPTLPSSGTVTSPFSLTGGSSSYTGIQVTSGSGNAITGDNATHVKTLSLTDCLLTGFNYALYLGDCGTLNAHNCVITSTTGGNNYAIRGYIREINIGCSTITNPGSGGSTKACFRAYGFEGGLIHDTVFTGDRVMLGGGASAEAVNPLDSYGLLIQDCDMVISTLEIYPETHHITFENCDFTLSHITCWGADSASLQDPACHDITFINCTNNGHALNFAQDFNGGSNVAAHALVLNIIIV